MFELLKKWRETQKMTVADAAAKAGVTAAMWSRWETGMRRIPAERVLDLERLTGISRHDFRPDVYGPKDLEAAE